MPLHGRFVKAYRFFPCCVIQTRKPHTVIIQCPEILPLVFALAVYSVEHITGRSDPKIEIRKSSNNPPA